MRNKLIVINAAISVIAIILTQVGFRENYSLMLTYSIIVGIIYFYLIKLEVDNYQGLNLNLILLFGYIMRLAYPSITMAYGAMNGEHYYYIFESDITDYMFACIPWMNIYYMIFYYVFSKYTSNYAIDEVVKPFLDKYNLTPLAIVCFIIGEVYNVIIYTVPTYMLANSINVIFSKLSLLGLLVLVFVAANDCYSRSKKRLLLIFVIVAMLRAIFFGFYKEAIIMPFAFYILYLFMAAKKKGARLMTTRLVYIIPAFFLLTHFVIYPFMTIKRNVSGFDVSYGGTGGVAVNQFSSMEILEDIFEGKYVKDDDKGSTFDRLSAVANNTYFYRDVCLKNQYNREIAIDNLVMLVPRFLYPEKHTSRAGLMVNSYVSSGTVNNYMYATSFSNIGQFASAYFMGGPILALLFAVLNGMFLSYYYKFLLKNISNILSLVFLATFLLLAFKTFEEVSDGGITRAGMLVYYMIAIKLTNIIFKRKSQDSGYSSYLS